MISLSFSACQKYLLSPLSYYLHYTMRLRPVETGSALVFGSAVDSGLNSLLTDKKNGIEVDVEKAKLAFDKEFQSINPNSIKYSKADFDESLLIGEDKNSTLPLAWLSLRRKGHIILDEYKTQVLPRIKEVLLVQHQIKLKNDLGDEFVGIIDLVCRWEDNRIYIADNKTSSVKYAQDAVGESGQLASYFEAMSDVYKLSGAIFIVIPKKVRKRKKPAIEIEFVIGEISEELVNKTFESYDNVLTGIRLGQFHCTRNEQNGCCSLPWPCSFRRYCESDGKDLTGLTISEKKR